MTVWRLIAKEILHRKMNFLSAVLSVVVASGVFIGSLTVLRIHDQRTSQILAEKQTELEERMVLLQDDTRKAMLKLGFNIVILPEGQNLADWYSDDFASKTMPEKYVNTLANSGIVTVRHFLPSLQQKIDWPEKKRKIILMGTRGEVPNLHKDPRKPLVEPVARGTINLGYELHRSMDLDAGQKVSLMGREFVIDKCYDERGNKDDITAWIHLQEAQQIMNKQGAINAILALECLCTGEDVLPRIRKEISAILPGTQVIERGSRAIARAEARVRVAEEAKTAIQEEKVSRENLRMVRERFTSILTPLIIAVCAVWIAMLGFTNVRARREEIGILRAIGISAKRILVMFLSKFVIIGFLGGIIGCCLGRLSADFFGSVIEGAEVGLIGSLASWTGLLTLSVGGATLLAVIAGWIPAIIAAGQDPADILREE